MQLKLLQRERALAMGLDLIEWTYDPLQAMNAHLNFAKLGVVAEEYEVNVYGTSSSPLHGGNPTDRFVAEWWIRKPHVEQRLAGVAPLAPVLTVEPARPRGTRGGEWLERRATSISRSRRSGSASRFRWGSPTCCRAHRTWRSRGAWPPASSSRTYFGARLSGGGVFPRPRSRARARTCW